MQLRERQRMIWTLFDRARDGLWAAKNKPAAGIDIWMLSSADKLEAFDVRTLERPHDLIAESFRALFSFDRLPFRADEFLRDRFLIASWLACMESEATDICKDGRIAKAVVEAARHGVADPGYEASKLVSAALQARYASLRG